jgi:cell wall-associated NlpC family hydrolase
MPYGSPNLLAKLRAFDPNPGQYLEAEDLVAAGNKYGVDPRALAVIALKESEWGKTSGRFKNNAFGWGVHLGPDVNTSPTWQAGAEKVAKGLAGGLYKGAGLSRLRQVVPKYAPPSENNTDLYINQIEGWYRSMGGDPNKSIFDFDGSSVPQSEADTGPSRTPTQSVGTLEDSIRGAFGDRQQGESLFRTVMRGAMASMASQQDTGGADQAMKAVEGATLKLGAASSSQEEAVQAAMSQKGVNYVWGGTDPRTGPGDAAGLDCSGLTQWAWKQAGVNIPRVTYDQIKVGRGIATNDQGAWRPGDLLFPHRGHVMMYIGGGKAIHAPRTGDVVRIVPANSRTYIAVRRPG